MTRPWWQRLLGRPDPTNSIRQAMAAALHNRNRIKRETSEAALGSDYPREDLRNTPETRRQTFVNDNLPTRARKAQGEIE